MSRHGRVPGWFGRQTMDHESVDSFIFIKRLGEIADVKSLDLFAFVDFRKASGKQRQTAT
jgi:hypothetical protein